MKVVTLPTQDVLWSNLANSKMAVHLVGGEVNSMQLAFESN